MEEREYSSHVGRWEPGRFLSPDRAVGDFDGDSEADLARVWVHERGDRWILVAYLSTRPDDPVTVFESGRRAELGQRPIRAIPAGAHETHRYFGIGPGGPDTTAIVVLTHEAIHLARTESEGVVFVWNAATETFDSIDLY